MNMRTVCGAAVAALAISMGGAAIATADPMPDDYVDVAPYLVGDTVYFSAGNVNCAMHPNGDVGCDIPPGIAKWFDILPVTDLAIDLPFLPAHPTFTTHGRPSPRLPSNGYGYASNISYGGATCYGGGRGATGCRSKGHSFSFGWSGTETN